MSNYDNFLSTSELEEINDSAMNLNELQISNNDASKPPCLHNLSDDPATTLEYLGM